MGGKSEAARGGRDRGTGQNAETVHSSMVTHCCPDLSEAKETVTPKATAPHFG